MKLEFFSQYEDTISFVVSKNGVEKTVTIELMPCNHATMTNVDTFVFLTRREQLELEEYMNNIARMMVLNNNVNFTKIVHENKVEIPKELSMFNAIANATDDIKVAIMGELVQEGCPPSLFNKCMGGDCDVCWEKFVSRI